MTSTTRRALMTAVVCTGLTAAGSTAGQSARDARPASPQMTLGVAGAVNATPSLAVNGRDYRSSLDGVEGRRRERVRRDQR